MAGTHRLLMGSQWEDEIVAKASPSPCPPGIPGRFTFSKVLVTFSPSLSCCTHPQVPREGEAGVASRRQPSA